MSDNEYILDPEELAPPKLYTAERRAEINEQIREAANLCREINGDSTASVQPVSA